MVPNLLNIASVPEILKVLANPWLELNYMRVTWSIVIKVSQKINNLELATIQEVAQQTLTKESIALEKGQL